jgi:hypothetical protein
MPTTGSGSQRSLEKSLVRGKCEEEFEGFRGKIGFLIQTRSNHQTDHVPMPPLKPEASVFEKRFVFKGLYDSIWRPEKLAPNREIGSGGGI